MADVSEVEAQDVGIDDEEELDVEDDGNDEAEEASLDDLYEHEIVAEQASGNALEDEDDMIVKAMESAGDEPTETLTTKVRPRASGEFMCQECFLIKPAAQLGDADSMICVDCM